MTEFPGILGAAILSVLLVLAAFGSLGYAWIKWRGEVNRLELSGWRRAAANLGFLAVAAQAALFIAFWGPIGRDYVLFREWARAAVALFVVALPLSLAGKGASRRWLLGSSVLLFVVCFFVILSK
jgi:hypothetical protein